jgi:hypothetical protein
MSVIVIETSRHDGGWTATDGARKRVGNGDASLHAWLRAEVDSGRLSSSEESLSIVRLDAAGVVIDRAKRSLDTFLRTGQKPD